MQLPNWTDIPNNFFELMPELSNQEMRVMLAAFFMYEQQIYGIRKDKRMWVHDFVTVTGMQVEQTIEGLDEAMDRGWLAVVDIAKPDDEEAWAYTLNFEDDDENQNT